MAWVEYREADGYVVAIHETLPEKVADGFVVAETQIYSPGDEHEHYIVVNDAQGGQVRSTSSVRQSPPTQEILSRISSLEARVGAIEKPKLERG